jgi:hypothetical protein
VSFRNLVGTSLTAISAGWAFRQCRHKHVIGAPLVNDEPRLGLEAASKFAGSIGSRQGITDSVLDLNKLHWDNAGDLRPLLEKPSVYRSRIRLILPRAAVAQPEMILAASRFHDYRTLIISLSVDIMLAPINAGRREDVCLTGRI